MKKILSIALVLILCLSMLVACGKDTKKDEGKKDNKTTVATSPKGDGDTEGSSTDSETPAGTTTGTDGGETDASLKDAKDFLVQMYQTGKPTEAMVIKADMDVLASAMGYDIAWSVSITKGDAKAVQISDSSKENHVKIDIADSVSADVEFTAIATITDAEGNSEKAEFLFSIPGPKADPKADSTLTVKEAIELGSSKAHNVYTTGKYYIVATVVEVTKAEYGNMKVKDDQGNTLTIYGSYGPDGKDKFTALNPQPKSGDKVKLYGIIGQYNDTPQMKNAWIKEINGKKPATAPTSTRPTTDVKEPAANSEVSIADAIAIALSKESGIYTTNKYYVTGTVTEIYNEVYGNMKIKDSKGNILTLYGTYDANGGKGYADLAVKPKVGDTVTIYGKIGNFNGDPQIKNGWIRKINGVEQKADKVATASVVKNPVVGTKYKMGFYQTQEGADFYFSGVMSGFYGATVNDPSKAVDVQMEKSGDGYKLFFTDANGSKQYIKLEQSGTHYNFTFGSEGSVFTYDADKNSFSAPCGDQICYMGTYGSYKTVGCLTTAKLKDGDYIVHLYKLDD